MEDLTISPTQRRRQWTSPQLHETKLLVTFSYVATLVGSRLTPSQDPAKGFDLLLAAHEMVGLLGEEILGQEVDQGSVQQQTGRATNHDMLAMFLHGQAT